VEQKLLSQIITIVPAKCWYCYEPHSHALFPKQVKTVVATAGCKVTVDVLILRRYCDSFSGFVISWSIKGKILKERRNLLIFGVFATESCKNVCVNFSMSVCK
jgi:hypothetical protein